MFADTGTEAPTANPYTKLMDYDGNGNLLYEGWARAGSMTSQPVWAIKRHQFKGFGGNLREWRADWANGASSQTNVWDNRATLSYA